MIKQDYIMRQIELMVKAIAKVLGLEIKENYTDALKTIDNELKNLAGIDFDFVNTLTGSDLLTFLNINRDRDVVAGKCIIIAKLLKKRTEISIKLDKNYNPSDNYRKALMLLSYGLENCTFDNKLLDELKKDRELLQKELS